MHVCIHIHVHRLDLSCANTIVYCTVHQNPHAHTRIPLYNHSVKFRFDKCVPKVVFEIKIAYNFSTSMVVVQRDTRMSNLLPYTFPTRYLVHWKLDHVKLAVQCLDNYSYTKVVWSSIQLFRQLHVILQHKSDYCSCATLQKHAWNAHMPTHIHTP